MSRNLRLLAAVLAALASTPVAAHADARHKVEAVLQEKMKMVTGGLPLPPGMKLF